MEGRSADQTVVIAVDHSQHAEDAVKYYLDKMHRKGNKLMLVHCVELPEMNRNVARDCHISPAVLASMWKEEEAKSRVLENKMKQLLTNRGVSAKLRSCAGRPGDMICKIAEEQDAAYIVTGTRGGHASGQRGSVGAALQQSIVGGVSDYLLRHARCPVVVCRDAESIRRQRHASEGKARRRHQSAKAGGATSPGSETFASSFRRRFLSGSKETTSMDAADEARVSAGEGQGLIGKGDEARRGSGAATSGCLDLPILFHSSVQLYPSSSSVEPLTTGGAEPLLGSVGAQASGPQAVAVKN